MQLLKDPPLLRGSQEVCVHDLSSCTALCCSCDICCRGTRSAYWRCCRSCIFRTYGLASTNTDELTISIEFDCCVICVVAECDFLRLSIRKTIRISITGRYVRYYVCFDERWRPMKRTI